jgi:hypothetical protein
MGSYLGWDARRIASEVERYRAIVGANEGFREAR